MAICADACQRYGRCALAAGHSSPWHRNKDGVEWCHPPGDCVTNDRSREFICDLREALDLGRDNQNYGERDIVAAARLAREAEKAAKCPSQPGFPRAPRCERDELSETIRELKAQWAATKAAVLCSASEAQRVGEIQKMNDLMRKLPRPPKPDIIADYHRYLAKGKAAWPKARGSWHATAALMASYGRSAAELTLLRDHLRAGGCPENCARGASKSDVIEPLKELEEP